VNLVAHADSQTVPAGWYRRLCRMEARQGRGVDRLLTIEEARSEIIARWGRHISVRTLARWCQLGVIPEAKKYGKTWLIPEPALERIALTVGRDAPESP